MLLPESPTNQIIYATNSEGKKSAIASASALVSAGTQTSVSNRQSHFGQDQRLRKSCSLTYSDHSGAIRGSPHFAQVVSYLESRKDATVVMPTSLVLLLFPALRTREFWSWDTRDFSAAIGIDSDQKEVPRTTSPLLFALTCTNEIILLQCNMSQESGQHHRLGS
jgi:hypothetical protein